MTTEIDERNRRRNLKAIVGDKRGDIAAFARAYDQDPTVISSLLNGVRTFTEGYARKIEEAAGLPKNSLDLPDPHLLKAGEIAEVAAILERSPFMQDSPALKAFILQSMTELKEKYESK